jgi:hypothetical protein
MYSTCLFCNASLGTNEVVEHFPVGRRLAFDAAKGRLWVVCRSCERWSLSPLEERWEAIEECERLFRDTRMRVSTENMGLARLREGLELVRVGEPLRSEMAAWRYGDQFGRRRKWALIRAGLGIGALGAVIAGGAAAGVGIVGGWWWMGRGIVNRAVNGSPNAVVARLPQESGILEVRRKDLERLRLVRGEGVADLRLLLGQEPGSRVVRRAADIEFVGPDAIRAAGALLVPMNRFGGTRRQVDSAVELLEEAGDPVNIFARAARDRRSGGASPLKLDYPVRLALEMAAHEEQERRALQGELALLETAWKEAEEIAAISDSLLLPSGIDEWVRRLRGS